MKYSLSLGKILGIKVQIHWTFLILIFWIVFSNIKSGSTAQETLWAILFILSIFACVVMHEFGHALAARKFGIKTKDITLLPIGGLARLESLPEKPKEELIVAFAGPFVNIVIFLLVFPFIQIPDAINLESELALNTSDHFLFKLVVVNVWLAVFNLIPAFPMDGGRVLRAILSFNMPREKATSISAGIGQVLAIGFVIVGFYSNPFLIFIGLFIFLGAQSEASFTQTKSFLKGYVVSDVVMNHYESIQQHQSLQDAVKKLLNGTSKHFLVLDDSKPVGTLSRDEIIKGLSEQNQQIQIFEVMNKDILFLQESEPLELAWQKIQTNKSLAAVVNKNNQIVGALDLENILEFVMVTSAIKKQT